MGARTAWIAFVLALAVAGLLGLRRAAVPVHAWHERQWPVEALERPPTSMQTSHPRVRSPFYGLYVRPGDLVLEWSGFLDNVTAGRLGVRTVSTGPVQVRVARVPVIDSGHEGRAGVREGWTDVLAGPVEIVVRVTLGRGRQSFRAWLAPPSEESVPLEELAVTPEPLGREERERAARFERFGDPVLALAAVLAAVLVVLALRAPGGPGRRVAEAAAGILIVAPFFLLQHGPGLRFWGTAFWENARSPTAVVLVLLGLGLWVISWRTKRLALPAVARHPAVWAAAALVVTWLLREQRVWGDGWVTIEILEGRFAQGSFGPYFWKEPLDRIVAVVATRVAAGFGAGARTALATTSCVAGAWAAWILARHYCRRELAGCEAASFWTAGGAVLFFGHVENYTWVTAALLAFLLSARREVARPLQTGLLGGLCLAFHPVAVFQVLPVLVVLLFHASRREAFARFAFRLIAGVATPSVLLLAAAAAAGIPLPVVGLNRFAEDPDVLLAPSRALAGSNMLLALNRALLILSPGVLLGLALGLSRIRKPRPGTIVLLAASTGAVAHLVLLHGKLQPPVLDWDLYAPAYVPLALLAGRALSLPGDRTTGVLVFSLSAALLAVRP